MMKLLLMKFIFIFMVLFLPNNVKSQNELYNINTLVIDPGHGGKDPGALSQWGKEKDVVLAIGLKLRNYVQDSLPDVNVIMTRQTDEFIELYRRAKIANENKANVFISIHANSNESSSPSGCETFVMGLYKSKQNLKVAKQENQVILQETDYEQKYEGFDPNSPEGNIIFSLYQNAFLTQSLQIADIIQKHFMKNISLQNRGVKQAGFLVLWKTTMPSLLVETGFISNEQDAKFLLSPDGQDKIAYSIFQAFRDYKYQIEQQITIEDTVQISEPKLLDSGLKYSIQVLTSKKNIPLQSENFNGFTALFKKQDGIWNKYYIGSENSYVQIKELFPNVKRYYQDAFIVAFKDGNKISVKEAKKKEKQNL